MSSLLDLDHLVVTRGRARVVDQATFSIDRGETVALLGPNGAGKSSLVQAIAGLLPSTGRRDLRGRAAAVLQSPALARRSVRANLALALRWWGVPRADWSARIDSSLALMQVEHLARRPAGALSGGERRRVHLARGLAVEPDLLLLDEPFAGLDPGTHARLVEDAAWSIPGQERGVLLVVHDRADAWALADRVLVMMGGRIVADHAPDHLLSAPPSPEVAEFLGYDGRQVDGDQIVLTRSADIRLDDHSTERGEVHRALRLEDGAQLEIRTATGTLRALHDELVRPGTSVGFRVRHSVRFPLS